MTTFSFDTNSVLPANPQIAPLAASNYRVAVSFVDPELTLALPREVEHWSLTKLREKLIKIGAKVVRHGRYVTFQSAEVAVPRALFADILRRIDRLRPKPVPT